MSAHRSAVTSADLLDARRGLESELAALVDANRGLAAALERYSAASTRLAGLVHGERPLVDALDDVGGSVVRDDVNTATERQTAARHRVRLAMCRLALAQGTSLSRLARSLGISRQLVSRLAGEMSGGAGQVPEP